MDAKELESAVFKGVVKGALVVLGALLLVLCFWKILVFLIPIGILAAITTYVTSTTDPSHSGPYLHLFLHLFFVFILNAFLCFLVFFVAMPILGKETWGLHGLQYSYSHFSEAHWSHRLAVRLLMAGFVSLLSAGIATYIYWFWVVLNKNDLSFYFVFVDIVLSCVAVTTVSYLHRKRLFRKSSG